ncbi:redoxin domain-containing protein [candidate division KSB1 bacterium]|nr:redoxin domain-containing protein [candidate division KSB1 bacterium]
MLALIIKERNMMNKLKIDFFHLILYITLIGLSLEVIIIARQNKQHRTVIHNLNKSLASFSLQKGDMAQPFIANDLNGMPLIINFQKESPKTFLFIFSVECGLCEKNISFWNFIFEHNDQKKARILGVLKSNPDEVKLFAEDYKIKFPIFINQEPNFWWHYKLFRIPQTILISEQGTVERVWEGVLNKQAREDVMKLTINQKS